MQLERHKMLGFMRFTPLNGVARRVRADYDIVPLMIERTRRLPGGRFYNTA